MRKKKLFTVLALLLCQALAACGSDDAKKKIGIVFSPNGEPLSGGPLGRPECPVALGNWIDRVRQGGSLTEPLFLADAKRQFKVMDIDRVGLLTPDELARYRAPYEFYGRGRPHTGGRASDDDDDASPSGDEGSGRHHRRRDDDQTDRRRGSSHDISDDKADPVMSADRHNRNEVSLDDFLIYERQNFTQLDTNHDGQLSREEILTLCPDND